MTIGPSFAEELRQAGVSDFRFTWNPEGQIGYHPDVPDAERQKVEAVLKAHDGPLSEARHQALVALRTETRRRIAELFGQPPGSDDLIYAEINDNARGTQLVNKKFEGSALPEERLELEALDETYERVRAIRAVKADAKAALLGAKSVEEVQGVKAEWPKE